MAKASSSSSHTEYLSGNPVGNAVIGQSGGPTAVINQSLVGIIEQLRGQPGINSILGMKHGVRGLVSDQLIDLTHMNDGRLGTIAATPSAALGSSRDKPDEAYCLRVFEACARHQIHYFFYIGGNDSSDTCRIVNECAIRDGYELRCFHVPKTIDNDLPHSDHTPGYPSAARFVIQAFMGDNLDNLALPGIKINVVMGRSTGWLTAASMLARQQGDDGPHLICVPEVPFDEEAFAAEVERVYGKLGRCLIAVSEGIARADGTLVAESVRRGRMECDAHGNIQLSGSGELGDYLAAIIKQGLGGKVRIRSDTFGYLQRSFCGVVSEVDAREARGCGHEAAKLALGGNVDGSLAILRTDEKPYGSRIRRIDLKEVAALTVRMDEQYLSPPFDIHPGFRAYLEPLVGKLPVIARLI